MRLVRVAIDEKVWMEGVREVIVRPVNLRITGRLYEAHLYQVATLKTGSWPQVKYSDKAKDAMVLQWRLDARLNLENVSRWTIELAHIKDGYFEVLTYGKGLRRKPHRERVACSPVQTPPSGESPHQSEAIASDTVAAELEVLMKRREWNLKAFRAGLPVARSVLGIDSLLDSVDAIKAKACPRGYTGDASLPCTCGAHENATHT